MRFLYIFAVTISICSAIPLQDFSFLKSKKLKVTDPNYRLPVEYKPVQYDIELTPYFDTGDSKSFTFDGSVKLLVEALNNNTRIVLHASKLNILQSDINIQTDESTPKTIQISNITSEDQYEFFIINLNETLIKSSKYVISIKYTGILQDDMTGFYKSYYMENGVKKWLGTTQFQPVAARKAFPCFDEPMFKAKFVVTITRSNTMSKSLSNMPIRETRIGNGTVTETFYPTPEMSTYLLAFIVSEFTSPDANEDVDSSFGVWARPGAAGQNKYALEIGQKIVKQMGEYLNISYYNMENNMKMDQAAIPDFSAGAMENWGLLTYREAYLLYDADETNLRYKQFISTILAHEIAHQWFGDYTTCHWWSDTWLNEGFASFFEYRLSDMAGENLSLEDQFIIGQMQVALLEDASDSSAPLTNININSPDEINGHFGTISYKKGASVITMMENFLGASTFRKGLQYYLDSRKYKITEPKYLFEGLQKAADEDKVLENYKNITVQGVMESWTSQNGYPLITVNVNMSTGDVTITQKKFQKTGSTPRDVTYQVPITYTDSKNPSFENTKPAFILTEKTKTFNKGSNDHGWVILNNKARGFYRINYDSHTWGMITSTLISNRTTIHRFNRAQIVDDVFNLAREDIITYSDMFNVLEFLKNEDEYLPWTAAYSGFAYLRNRFVHENDTLSLIQTHMMNLMQTNLKKIGTTDNTIDSHLTKLFRSGTLKVACELGYDECIQSSKTLFANWMNFSTKVTPNLREHVYCNALRHGSDAEYDFLWNKHETTNVVNEKVIILGALGCTKREGKIMEYLSQTIKIDSPIRDQDKTLPCSSIVNGNSENALVVLKFFKSNLGALKTTYTPENLFSFINIMASRLSLSELDELTQFITNSGELTVEEKTSYQNIVQNARNNVKWASENKSKVSQWLDLKYNSAANVAVSFSLLLFALFAIFYNNKNF